MGETWVDRLERVVEKLTRLNDVRESQRPPPGEDPPACVVELEQRPSQH